MGAEPSHGLLLPVKGEGEFKVVVVRDIPLGRVVTAVVLFVLHEPLFEGGDAGAEGVDLGGVAPSAVINGEREACNHLAEYPSGDVFIGGKDGESGTGGERLGGVVGGRGNRGDRGRGTRDVRRHGASDGAFGTACKVVSDGLAMCFGPDGGHSDVGSKESEGVEEEGFDWFVQIDLFRLRVALLVLSAMGWCRA